MTVEILLGNVDSAHKVYLYIFRHKKEMMVKIKKAKKSTHAHTRLESKTPRSRL